MAPRQFILIVAFLSACLWVSCLRADDPFDTDDNWVVVELRDLNNEWTYQGVVDKTKTDYGVMAYICCSNPLSRYCQPCNFDHFCTVAANEIGTSTGGVEDDGDDVVEDCGPSSHAMAHLGATCDKQFHVRVAYASHSVSFQDVICTLSPPAAVPVGALNTTRDQTSVHDQEYGWYDGIKLRFPCVDASGIRYRHSKSLAKVNLNNWSCYCRVYAFDSRRRYILNCGLIRHATAEQVLYSLDQAVEFDTVIGTFWSDIGWWSIFHCSDKKCAGTIEKEADCSSDSVCVESLLTFSNEVKCADARLFVRKAPSLFDSFGTTIRMHTGLQLMLLSAAALIIFLCTCTGDMTTEKHPFLARFVNCVQYMLTDSVVCLCCIFGWVSHALSNRFIVSLFALCLVMQPSASLTINCTGDDVCRDQTLDCNNETDCTVICDGFRACQYATITGCAVGGNCTLSCIDVYSCYSAVIDSMSDITCSGVVACERATINARSSSHLNLYTTDDDYVMYYSKIYCPNDHTHGNTNNCNIFINGDLAVFGYAWDGSVIYAVEATTDVKVYCTGVCHSLAFPTLYCTEDYSESCVLTNNGAVDGWVDGKGVGYQLNQWQCADSSSVCADYLIPTSTPTRAPTLYCASYSGSISSSGKDWKLLSLSVPTDLVINACDSDYDTWLYLRSAVTGNDIADCDDCGDCGLQTVLSVPNVPAGEYEIGIGGYGSSSGSYNVKVTCSAPPVADPTSDPTAEPTTATPTTADPTTANPTIPATAEPTATDTAPCVPINTCFEEQSNAFSATSLMWSCESGGVVKKTSFDDTGCGGFPQVSTVNSDGGTGRTGSSLHGGVQTSGSSSGVVLTDYLQGTDCPVLDASPSSCTDYMVFRRYGDATYLTDTQEGIPYEDIGSDCVNKKNYLYSTFAVPIGCGLQPSVGSNEWNCNATHIWWLHYGDDTCGADGGSFQAAQSDVFEINTCGLFRDEWNYYFEEICGCDRPCSDVYTADPTTAAPTTAAPTTVAPTTATPTLSPLPTDTATASPTSVSPTTADPTTADPTTADPTTADPTTAADATTTDATDTTDATADPTATGVDDDDDEDENVAGAELVEADGGADARTWASVAIVIGVFLASLAGLFLVVFCWRKRKGADAADQSDAAAGDLLQDSTHNYLLNRNASLDLKLLGYLVIVVQVVCYVILLVAVWGDAGKHNVPVEVDHGYCTDEGNLSSNVAISGLYCEVNRPQDNMVAIIAGLLIVMSFVAPDVFAGLRLFKHHMMVSFLLLVESGIAVLVATLLIFETAEQGAVQVMAAGVSVIFIHDIDEKIKAAVDQIAQRWKCCCCCRNHCPTSNLFLLVAYFLGGFTINILVGFIVYCSANGCNY